MITKTLVGVAALGLALSASAATTTQAISGSQSAVENGCVNAIHIFTPNLCSYNGANRWYSRVDYTIPDITGWTQADTPAVVDGYLVDRPRNWIGPLANQMYYTNGDSPLSNGLAGPTVGDNKVALGVSGQLTIDDNNTAAGTDDLISGVIVIAAGTRNVLTGQDNNSRVEESWDSLTQTLAPTPVDSAAANVHGGFDYVIASRGMPDVLQAFGLNDQDYPSEIASSPILKPAVAGWVAPASQGRSVASHECESASPTPINIGWNNRRNRLRVGSNLGADCADPSELDLGATTTGEFTGRPH